MKTNKTNPTLQDFIAPIVLITLVIIWQLVSSLGLVPSFMLPSPVKVVKAFIKDLPLLAKASAVTLWEAFLGLATAIISGFALAILMDKSKLLERAVSPLMLLTQTIPTIALAPLLVLWLGYGKAPKVVLVFLTCFFPITTSLLSGLKQADADAITLLKAMGATQAQIYKHIKLPGAMPDFFSGLRISATYALVGAVVAEWLGGNDGLGVYMTRVRKAYAFDKMFAVIFLISLLSILLIQLIKWLEKKLIPWND